MTGENLMQEVMAAAPEAAPEIAVIAARYGLKEDDPAWMIATAVRDATAAGVATEAAATRIEAATQGVGEAIFNQTVRAGDDLKTLLKQALEEKTTEVGRTVVDVIRHSANEGAAAIKKAAASLPAAAAAQRDGIIQGWKTDFSSLAAQEAAQRAQRREWWWTGAAIALTLVAGLGGAWVGYQMAPQAWPASSPPALVARFPGEVEYRWNTQHAFVPTRTCPPHVVCLVLKK